MTQLLDLCRFAADLRLADAPLRVQGRLRLQGLSVLGATAAGSFAPDAAAVRAVADRDGRGSRSYLPAQGKGGGASSLRGALLAAPSLSMAQDFDDYLLCGHTGHSAVWGAWLGAAEWGLPWDDALRIQLAANELMGRLGGACLAGRQNGQAWTFLHSFAGALIRGMLAGSSPRRLAHGVALALARAPSVDWGLFHSSGKLVAASTALLDGWRSAELAEAGLEGPLDILDPGSDFFAVFADGSPIRGWFTGLGEAWLSETLAFKQTPGCAYLATAVEVTAALLRQAAVERGAPIRPSEILSIEVDAGLLTCEMERLLGALPAPGSAGDGRLHPVAVNFSVARSLALLVARGSLGPEDLSAEALAAASRDAGDLPRRVRVHHDWKWTLQTWEHLRERMDFPRLLGGIGAGGLRPLLARARRPGRAPAEGLASGEPSASLSWADLPVALAAERFRRADGSGAPARGLADELLDDPGATLGRGVSRVSAWASGRLRKAVGLVEREPGAVTDRRYDLGRYELSALALPLPARSMIVLKDGRVLEGEAVHPRGCPGRPEDEIRADVRRKFTRSCGDLRQGAERAFVPLADELIRAGGELPALEDGPADFLARLASA